MSRSTLIDVACKVRKETEKGIAIWDGDLQPDGREKWTWLPKSEVEVNDDGTVSMPEWLATEKGLI